MYKKELEENILRLISFRSNMGLSLSREKVKYIWDKDVKKKIPKSVLKRLDDRREYDNSKIIELKLDIAKKNLNILYVFNWVKFIGVSGSVAAGFAKQEDDIDVFIVVKNGCAWIYRGVLAVRNIFNHVIRTKRDGEHVQDLFCVNFIVEERGLLFDSDMFNFHELMYLIPVYNPKYLKKIYGKNIWLKEVYMIDRRLMKTQKEIDNDVNILFRFMNRCAFLLQLVYMLFTGHRPEIGRLFSNYSNGKIEFFPSYYKKRILDGLRPLR